MIVDGFNNTISRTAAGGTGSTNASMGCYTIDIHDNVTCDDSGVNRIYFAGGIKSAKSVTSAGFSNTNDQGFGGLTWTAQNGASACVFLSNNATTSGITVSQDAQAFTVSVPAGVAATSSNCFHSASWSNFTGHSISFKYNTGAGGTKLLLPLRSALTSRTKSTSTSMTATCTRSIGIRESARATAMNT